MRYRIVIIEDEYYTRQAIVKQIGSLGDAYEVAGEASNGEEGLELLRMKQPDIALVDITMPVMNGIDMISAARREGIQTAIIILTGYSEFSYAQAAVKLGVCDYLLKPLRGEDLANCLNVVVESLHERQQVQKLEGLNVHNLLKSQLAELLMYSGEKSMETDTLMEYLEFPAQEGTYYVALVQIHRSYARDGILLNAVSTIVEEESNSRQLHALAGLSGSHSIYLLLNATQPMMPEELRAYFEAVGRRLNARVNAQIKIVMSRGTQDIQGIRELYLTVQLAQMRALFESDKPVSVYTPDDMNHWSRHLTTQEIRQELRKHLQAQDAQGTRRFIERCFAGYRQSTASANSLYLFALELLMVIMQYQHDRGISYMEIPWDGYQASMPFSMDHVDELKHFVCQYADDAIRSNSNEGVYAGSAKKIRNYIDAHFADTTLHLEDIARANALSVQHMCMVYKQATGKTIGDTLFQVRMNHAAELIRRGQRNVALLAEACGYEDPSYFSRCFRKYYGVTPRQYITNISS